MQDELRLQEIDERLASGDWVARLTGVEGLAALLRTVPGAALEADLAARLERLSGDPKWEVRRAVALALLHLRHPSFDRILARLAEDPDAPVARAAERTDKRRRQTRRREQAHTEECASVLARLDALRAQHPPDLVEQAVGIGRAYYAVAAAMTSHDTVNVLTSVRMTLRALAGDLRAQEVPAETWAPHLDRIERLAGILEHVAVNLERLANDAPTTSQRERLAELVEQALGLVRDRFRDDPRAPRVATRVEVDPELRVEVPREGLVLALVNVLKNAFEAIEAEGTVTVRAAQTPQGELALRIGDDGCGVPEDKRRAVFLPGWTTKKAREGRRDNTGMGLAIAQKIVVEQCGGELLLQSEEGRGTEVTLLLPLAPAERGA
ncbi:MAG: ATP-binding protein [Vicinamibacteria bacterium]